jgi:hypothetical protein
VTTRAPQPHDAPLNPDPNKNNPFSAACRLQPLDKSLVVLGIIATADAGAAAAVAVSVALAPLLVPSITIGDYIAAITNLMTQFGLIDVAKQTVNALLSSQQGPHDIADLSYKVMDTYDYQANCFKGEVPGSRI